MSELKESQIGFRESCQKFLVFAKAFEVTELNGSTLKILDDFGFYGKGDVQKRKFFRDKVTSFGLNISEEKREGGSYLMAVVLPMEIDGVKRIEYYLTKDN